MKLTRFIDYFINPSYFENSIQLWRSRLLIRSSLLTSLFSGSYVWLSIVFDFEKSLYLMVFNVVGFLLLPFLVKTKIPVSWIGNLYVAIGAFAIFILTYYSGGAWSAVYPWIISIPVLAILVVNRTSGIVWGAISFLFMEWYAYLAYNRVDLPKEYNPELYTEWYVTVLPGLLLIILLIAFVFEYIQSKSLKSLEEKNKLLESQKETIASQSEELEELIEEKDYIIRILAHDLRNPLANIRSVANLMTAENDEDRQKEYLNIINQSSSSAHNLIDRVLEMDALGHETIDVNLEPVGVYEILMKVVDSMGESARKKQIEITLENCSETCRIRGERTYLAQIFENLLSNAVKFSEEGKKIRVVILNNKNRVQVKFIDSGPGIKKEEEDKLFKKFSKLSSRPTAGETSTGLGLSLVKRYVELLKGSVWHEANEMGGATFVVELPLAD